MNDPYKVLGVSRDADDEEIKKHTESLQKSIIPISTRTQTFRSLQARK